MRSIDFFDKGAHLYPDNLALIDIASGEEITYRQAQLTSHYIASAIRGNGYAKGTKIGILAPNCNLAFLALLGLMRAEAVWLPINPRNSIHENMDLIDRFEGEVLFYHSCFAQEAKQIQTQVAAIKTLVCLDDHSDEALGLSSWIEPWQMQHQLSEENRDDLFALFPTGGTTGKPKGVMLSHKNIETLMANFWSAFRYHDNTRHLVVAPMTHSAGVLGFAHFARGGTNVMMSKVDPEGILRAVEQYGITHYFVPPTVLYMMLALPNVRDYDQSSLQHLFIGAAPTSLEKLKEAIDVFGPVMTEAFGQTEAPASITVKAPWDYMTADGEIIESRLASIGRAAAFNQVAILDDKGQVLPHGEQGEICVKGDLVTQGYFQNEQATAEVRTFGWHHTGDIGVMDKDGFITIVDRKKDMIITGGFNVFPNEIEQVLTSHPAVQDCAVIGVPDEKWGEAVKGVVQLKADQQVDTDELIAFCKTHLDSVKAPKSIDIVADLPRSSVGKVLKKDIRKRYWGDRSRAVN